MRAAWATDIHLGFCDDKERRDFYRTLVETRFDVLLLTGDIGGESHLGGSPEPLDHTETVRQLKEMEESVRRPIYFVLGNHDYYLRSMAAVRTAVVELCRGSELLHFVQEDGSLHRWERRRTTTSKAWPRTAVSTLPGTPASPSLRCRAGRNWLPWANPPRSRSAAVGLLPGSARMPTESSLTCNSRPALPCLPRWR